MKDEPDFQRWFDEVYEKRYPSPQRNSTLITPEAAQQYGFDFAHHENYENEVHFTVESIAAYLITQSNVIAATEQGNEKVENVYSWLMTQIKPFFSSEEAAFTFGGYLWYLRKLS
jgi:hypothetical protein